MNLQALTASAVRGVTPSTPAQLYLSTGSTVGGNGRPVPSYAAPVPVAADLQAASEKDLRQAAALNIQQVARVAYLQGNVEGINRVRQKGGDMLVIAPPAPAADVGNWLVTGVLETWGSGGWCKVALTLQTEAPA